LRNLKKKLSIKETSLQEMKTELESYKENNMQQLFQIMSLRDDIKDLQELTASLTRIRSLKNTNIKSLKRGNWDLTEQILELENHLRAHLLEREKAEGRADFLEKNFSGVNRFIPYMRMKGQEDSLDIFLMKILTNQKIKNFGRGNIFHSKGPKGGHKIWDKCQQDLAHKEKQTLELVRPPYSFDWETKTAQSQCCQSSLGLPSDGTAPVPATEEVVKKRIQEIGAVVQSWKSVSVLIENGLGIRTHHLRFQSSPRLPNNNNNYNQKKSALMKIDREENLKTTNSQIDKDSKNFEELEKNNTQQMLLNIQQNWQIATTQRLEEKVQKLQKQLSDLKLSNKSMKTQLTRVNVLKDKTIEKLKKSLTKVETMKEKAAMKTENLKVALDSSEQEVKSDNERAHQMSETVTPELPTAKSTCEVAGQEQKLADFRETIMKMLGFNMTTADKEIINQLRIIIQVYEISKKSKIVSQCETRNPGK
uniref:Coiled-coil domain containing 170 n=2 Tax=Otolemur garnettii TaxID=30611 RepID=H0XK12_OTOGA